MKTLDSILQTKKTFEPSEQVKKLILKSIKKPLVFTIGAQDVKVPGFISFDTDKYKHFTMLVYLLYALEGFAAFGILVTTNQPFYIIIKLFLVVVLLLLDIFIAKHNRSKDDELNSNLFRREYLKLLRDFYMKNLTDAQLTQIRSGIDSCNASLKQIKSFMNKVLILLIVLGILKLIVFYLDYIIEGVDWEVILSKDAGFLSFFFGAPIAYLSIPFIAWVFYGKWIWTGQARKNLEKEFNIFLSEVKRSENDGVGAINNCVNTYNNRPITLGTLIEGFSKILSVSDDSSGSPQPSGTRTGISFTEGVGSSWKIRKINQDYIIDFYGLLSDNELLKIVSLQSDIKARKLLLLICMTNQIIQSQSSSRNSVSYPNEFKKIVSDVENLK